MLFKRSVFACALALAAFGAAAQSTPAQRYQADLKLCNDEPTSTARLQCRRDAKTEYDNALAEAKAHAAPAAQAAKPKTTSPAAACADCGTVTEVGQTEKAGEGSPVGLIAGGVGGAILGRQIGSGTGRDIATIAGAAAGAYAGKKIEEKIKTHKVWTVGVQFTGGATARYEFDTDPGYKVGDAVRKQGNGIARQ